MENETIVELEARGVASISVDVEHAERILRTYPNGGWGLPKKSPFTFSQEHGIRRKSDPKDSERETTASTKEQDS